jgi:hypothetical protein
VRRKPVSRYRFWTVFGTLLFVAGAWFLVTGVLAPDHWWRFLETVVFFYLGTLAFTRFRHVPDSN